LSRTAWSSLMRLTRLLWDLRCDMVSSCVPSTPPPHHHIPRSVQCQYALPVMRWQLSLMLLQKVQSNYTACNYASTKIPNCNAESADKKHSAFDPSMWSQYVSWQHILYSTCNKNKLLCMREVLICQMPAHISHGKASRHGTHLTVG